MAEILAVTFPFFALVLAGYLATRWRWLTIESIPGLNTFVLYFALPCLLYRFGSSTPIAQLLDVPLFLMYLFCALLMVGFVVMVTRNQRIGWNDAAFGALVAAFHQHRVHGGSLAGGLAGRGVGRSGHREYRGGLAFHRVLVHCALATGWCR